MKTKLTLTIDSGLIPKAKAMAGRKGKSLSGWVEERLRDAVTEEKQGQDTDRIGKWAGAFKDIQDPDQAKAAYLKQKYGL